MSDVNQLSEHFHLNEFVRPADRASLPASVRKNLVALANSLERVREFLGNRPMRITSGYRSPQHNARVGGAPNSQHVTGKAADFVVDGLPAFEVYAKLDPWWEGGLGRYPSQPEPGRITHVDIRQGRARWSH